MRNSFTLFFLVLVIHVFSQNTQLQNKTWTLQKVVMDNQEYLVPQNTDFILTYIIFQEDSFTTRGCNWLSGNAEYVDNQVSFTQEFYAAGDCSEDESIAFSTTYFDDFLVSNLNESFTFLVEQYLENVFTLTLTNTNGDQAVFSTGINEELQNYTWTLSQFNSPTFNDVPSNIEISEVLLNFSGANMETSACNSFFGSYALLSDNLLRIDGSSVTLAECNPYEYPENNTFDQAYMSFFFNDGNPTVFNYFIDQSLCGGYMLTIEREGYYAEYYVEGMSVNDQDDINNKLEIYPNPVQDILNITGNITSERYKIIDINGKVVQSGKMSQAIEVSHLIKGAYFLSIGKQTLKFFKK